MQISCIIELYEMFNIPNKSEVIKRLKALQIFEFRNIAGAHTVNFQDNSGLLPQNIKKNFFRITQVQINAKGDNLHVVDGFHNLREYNLYELVMEYNMLSEEYLFNAVKKYYKSILPHGHKFLDEWIAESQLFDFSHFNYRGLYKNAISMEKYLLEIKHRRY